MQVKLVHVIFQQGLFHRAADGIINQAEQSADQGTVGAGLLHRRLDLVTGMHGPAFCLQRLDRTGLFAGLFKGCLLYTSRCV